jgi:hypothetical protein
MVWITTVTVPLMKVIPAAEVPVIPVFRVSAPKELFSVWVAHCSVSRIPRPHRKSVMIIWIMIVMDIQMGMILTARKNINLVIALFGVEIS